MEDISSAVSSMRPVSGHSNSPSVDGNYVFTPPKDEAAEVPGDPVDRPRLQPLDIPFQNDGMAAYLPLLT